MNIFVPHFMAASSNKLNGIENNKQIKIAFPVVSANGEFSSLFFN